MKRGILGLIGLLAWTMFLGVPVGALDTNNFTITSYGVQMTLDKDSDNRSQLITQETIVAQFPDYDQNHGLERQLVDEYNGHTTHLKVLSVEDFNRQPIKYSLKNNVLQIGDASTYVHGSQTYVIRYSQQDVTRYYSDTDRDEFYWDVIGNEWGAPIQQVTLQLNFSDSLSADAKYNLKCYRGAAGATNPCDRAEPGALESTVTVYENNLSPGEGLTVAVGFAKGTFAAYQLSMFEKIVMIWGVVQMVLSVVGVALLAGIFVWWWNQTIRKKELGTIVPEYLPPKEASVTIAARVGRSARAVMTAQLLDLAVRHYIKIYEVKEKTLFGAAQYQIEVVKSITSLRWEEKEVLKDMFGDFPDVGQRLNLKSLKNSMSYNLRTRNNYKDSTNLLRGEYGFMEQDARMQAQTRKIAMVVCVFAVVLVSPMLALVAAVTFALSFESWRLSDTGLALRRYLEGLKMYIGVAEEERIKMLQSPEGAAKVATTIDGTEGAQLVTLYERVLPYAVLFGLEKQWNKQLGAYYETSGTQPDWYQANSGVFNAVVFSAAMSNFSAVSTVSSSSSSTGGSGGGGFSGGGGGGGGGGGW